MTGDLLTTLDAGEWARELAASSDGQWYQVVAPGRPDETAWVLATNVRPATGSP